MLRIKGLKENYELIKVKNAYIKRRLKERKDKKRTLRNISIKARNK